MTFNGKSIIVADIWVKHRFYVDVIAREAQIEEEIIFTMLRAQPVSRKDAENVLATLSRVLQQEYTLDTVYVPLLPEEDEDAKDKR